MRLDLVIECLKHSKSFWHSLSVLTTANLSSIEKRLDFDKIEDRCRQTVLIMVGAYDGEGYVFWEKNPGEGATGFFCA